MHFTVLTVLCIFYSVCVAVEEDYFWREYTGTVPYDAVTAGKDVNDNNVYIGQAPVADHAGVFPVEIHPGVKEVYAPIMGIHKVENYVKILSGPQQNFYWIPANATHLHTTLIGKHAVIGGYYVGYGYYYIGRISFHGGTRIVRVIGHTVGNAMFYFNDNGVEKSGNIYEVLVYSSDGLDDPCKNVAVDVRLNGT